MAKRRKRPESVGGTGGDGEDEDIAATRKAVGPLVKAGISHFRMASACGAHPEDMLGFLEGRVSLTPALRERLRDAVPGILAALEAR